MPKGVPAVRERQSERGRRLREETVLRPMDQIRQIPGGGGIDATGAWCYFINPKGATIRDALILYPNGGIPEMDNVRLRDRYGTNADYYRSRQRAKGYEYVGPVLHEPAIRRLLEVLEANRDDEDLFLMEEIADAKETAKTSDIPEVRNQARRRVRQLERRLETIRQGFDPDDLASELNEIAHAQQLAKLPPNTLRVMRGLVTEANEALIARFRRGKGFSGEGAPSLVGGSGDGGEGFGGKDSIEL